MAAILLRSQLNKSRHFFSYQAVIGNHSASISPSFGRPAVRVREKQSKLASFTPMARSNSSGPPALVKSTIDEDHRVATLNLCRPPVNSLSLEMLQALSSELKYIENNHPTVEGLVLASENPNILSAGLDINELYMPDPERLSAFWTSFQQAFMDLYGSRLATMCAIEGHAPAGGCVLSLCCDYRIMTGTEPAAADAGENRRAGPTIGLNETQLGIAAPWWVVDLMVRTVGFREAEKALSLGMLYTPEDALKVGLIDEIVPKDDVLTRAHAEARKWVKIPPQARVLTKQTARQAYIDDLKSRREEDTDRFCSSVRSETVQANLKSYLDGLKKKRSKL